MPSCPFFFPKYYVFLKIYNMSTNTYTLNYYMSRNINNWKHWFILGEYGLLLEVISPLGNQPWSLAMSFPFHLSIWYFHSANLHVVRITISWLNLRIDGYMYLECKQKDLLKYCSFHVLQKLWFSIVGDNCKQSAS